MKSSKPNAFRRAVLASAGIVSSIFSALMIYVLFAVYRAYAVETFGVQIMSVLVPLLFLLPIVLHTLIAVPALRGRPQSPAVLRTGLIYSLILTSVGAVLTLQEWISGLPSLVSGLLLMINSFADRAERSLAKGRT